MISIRKTSNTTAIHWGKSSLTFWSRATASCGWAEAYRGRDFLYAVVHAWGWSISLQLERPMRQGEVEGVDYFHTYFNVKLDWLHYDKSRGGAFAHFKWAQRMAQRAQDLERERRLLALQQRKNWWEASRGQWWEFDEDETRSYYKFARAVYKMTASEAWERAKEKCRDA